MSDMLERISELKRRKQMVEDEIAKASGYERVKLLLTIPEINV